MQDQAITQQHLTSKCGDTIKMAWGLAGKKTITSAGDDINVTSIPDSNTNTTLLHIIGTGGTNEADITFNGVVSQSYTDRRSVNYGADTAQVDQNNFRACANAISNDNKFMVMYCSDVAGECKLCTWNSVSGEGSATQPASFNQAGKFTGTATVSSINSNNDGAGDYDTNSNMTVLGDDITASSPNIQTNSVFSESDTGKDYLWNGTSWTQVA
jgi:hypothetical protein